MSDEIKSISLEQNRSHNDMRSKFEVNLKDIQTQLNKHSEERALQQSENEKLRENLAQVSASLKTIATFAAVFTSSLLLLCSSLTSFPLLFPPLL